MGPLPKRCYSSAPGSGPSVGESPAVVIYSNICKLEKEKIIRENRNKSGIYRWTNKLNGKSYVGSSINLSKRLNQYFSKKVLLNRKFVSVIHKALLKYKHESFKLEILEYCDKKDVIVREQFYLDLLKPNYNIYFKAGSPLGFKHSEKTKLLMSLLARRRRHTFATRMSIGSAIKGRVVSAETREKLANKRKGKLHTEESKLKMRASSSLGLKHTQETKDKIAAKRLGYKS